MADQTSTVLVLPPYKSSLQPIRLELEPAYAAEARLPEIALAGRDRAKDLFATFTRAYVYASKLHSMAKLHVARAAIEARKRRAVVLLDRVPALAKEKGFATTRSPTGAEDVREAFLWSDQEYIAIEESRAALEAVEALLFGKMMAFRDAADACRAMLSPEDRPRLSNAEVQPNAYGSDEKPDMMERGFDEAPRPAPTAVKVDGFGRPNHG